MKWLVLIVNTIAVAFLTFNTSALVSALVVVQTELILTPSITRWVVNGYILAAATCIILGGRLGDLFGHFKVLFWGMLLFSLSALFVAIASEGYWMLTWRLVQGASVAVIGAGALSSLVTVFPERLRALAISVWGGMAGIGIAIGPLVGGALATFTSWRLIFLISSGGMFVIAFFNLLFWKHFKSVRERKPLDLLGFVLLVAWMIPLIFLLMEGREIGFTHPLSIAIYIWFPTALALFIWRELKAPYPLINFGERRLMKALVIFCPAVLSLIAFLFIYSRFLQWPLIYGLSPFEAGKAMLPLNTTLFVTALLSSQIAKRIGFKLVVLTGMTLLFVGFTWMGLDPLMQHYLIPLLILGVGFGLTFPVIPHIGLSALSKKEYGEGSGAINTVHYLSGCAGISIGTLIYLNVAEIGVGLDAAEADTLLMGKKGSLQGIGNDLAVSLQAGVISGFASVMFFGALLALVGLLCTLFFIPGKNSVIE